MGFREHINNTSAQYEHFTKAFRVLMRFEPIEQEAENQCEDMR